MKDASLVFSELLKGLEMTTAGRFNSGYKVVMPGSENIYQRIRIANHPYSINEWTKHEIDGLPNVRYSIFIYNQKIVLNLQNYPKLNGVQSIQKEFRYMKRDLTKNIYINYSQN